MFVNVVLQRPCSVPKDACLCRVSGCRIGHASCIFIESSHHPASTWRCQGKNTSCETSAHPRARIAGGRSREYLFNELEGEPHRPSRAPRHWFLFQRSHARLCRRLRGAVRLPGVRRRCRGTSLGWLTCCSGRSKLKCLAWPAAPCRDRRQRSTAPSCVTRRCL